MARPLEYKRRVQLSERDLDLKPPRARARSTPLVLGALAYGCAFTFAWAVSTNRLPLAETFTRVLSPPAEAKTKSRVDAVAPRIELQASLPAPEPLPVADLSKAAALEEPPPPTALEPVPLETDKPEPATVEPAKAEPPKAEPPLKLEVAKDELPKPAMQTAKEEPTPAPEKPVVSGGSCEAAIASYVEDANRKAPKDLGAADFGPVLNKGDYLDRCGVPTTTAVDICVAVQNGRAVGVTVRTAPGNAKLDRCLSRVLRSVSFPSHPRMDVVRTRFAN